MARPWPSAADRSRRASARPPARTRPRPAARGEGGVAVVAGGSGTGGEAGASGARRASRGVARARPTAALGAVDARQERRACSGSRPPSMANSNARGHLWQPIETRNKGEVKGEQAGLTGRSCTSSGKPGVGWSRANRQRRPSVQKFEDELDGGDSVRTTRFDARDGRS